MKTPDEIKKGLYCCSHLCGCIEGCPYEADGSCENADGVERDALAYIQQLEAELDNTRLSFAQQTREVEEYKVELLNQVKKTIEQLPQWISVEERLPESCGTYIAHIVHRYCKVDSYSRVCIEYFDADNTWASLHDVYEVTHWMPLPEPPVEVEHGR